MQLLEVSGTVTPTINVVRRQRVKYLRKCDELMCR